MGGRGKAESNEVHEREKEVQYDRWDWLKEVDDERLQGYIKRAQHVKDSNLTNDRDLSHDPRGRSIHHVSWYAQMELERRCVRHMHSDTIDIQREFQ